MFEFDRNGTFLKGSGRVTTASSSRIGFDPQGNIFVSDGYCNNRVGKYDKNGRFLAQAGSEKSGKMLGEFDLPHGLQVDERGDVWVADCTNNQSSSSITSSGQPRTEPSPRQSGGTGRPILRQARL